MFSPAQRPLNREIALSGELTLSGKLLPVTGLKEKAIAAKALNITELVLPRANAAEWATEMPPEIKDGLLVHFADSFHDVYPLLFLPSSPPLSPFAAAPVLPLGKSHPDESTPSRPSTSSRPRN